ERLEEPDLAAERAGGNLSVRAEVLALRGIDLIVACVAQDRQRERRQPDVRKHPVDQVLVRRHVVDVRLLKLVRADETDACAEAPRCFGRRALAPEAETRTELLLERQ